MIGKLGQAQLGQAQLGQSVIAVAGGVTYTKTGLGALGYLG